MTTQGPATWLDTFNSYQHLRPENGPTTDLGGRPVATVMSWPAVMVPEDDSLDEALHLLRMSGERHLAVIDDSGRGTGLLSDRQIAAAWVRDLISFSRTLVRDIAQRNQSMIDRRSSVADAARHMARCGGDAVVIVGQSGAPIRMLTAGDLIARLAVQPWTVLSPFHHLYGAGPSGSCRSATACSSSPGW